MKYTLTLALSFAVCMGCGSSEPETDVAVSSTPVDPIQANDINIERETPSVAESQAVASAIETIETIATSSDSSAVYDADEYIRQSGAAALRDLAAHMSDSRVPPGKSASLYQATKKISHTPEMSDYCYWFMQDIAMNSMFARVNREFAPFTKETAKAWVEKRDSFTQEEIRLDAAKGVLQSVKAHVEKKQMI